MAFIAKKLIITILNCFYFKQQTFGKQTDTVNEFNLIRVLGSKYYNSILRWKACKLES